MFKSKRRPIAVPQWEHQKLAGTLALLWGNANFERPPVPFHSFLTGIALHDRAYEPLDNLPIGELQEQEWLDVARRGFAMAWADPVADIIAKMHVQRLTGYSRAPARQAEAAAMDQAIQAQIQESGLDHALLARIDRITNLCDNIAFDFCYEVATEGAVKVFPRYDADEEVEVHYSVAEGTVVVHPWPFGVSSHTGYLVGYQLEGYPAVLEPVMLLYKLLAAKIEET